VENKVYMNEIDADRLDFLQKSKRFNSFEIKYLGSYSKEHIFDKICSFVKPILSKTKPLALIEVTYVPESLINETNLFFLE
jgi:hypothetical protein